MLDELKAKLTEEIDRLAHELHVVLPETIRKAVELGDLKENSEYKFAKERQQFVQARIGQMTMRIMELSKIDVTVIPHDRIGFGSRVVLIDQEYGDEVSYTLVFGDFIDLDQGHISMASPIGRALLGHQVGDEVIVELPKSQAHYTVQSFETIHQMVETKV